MTYEDDETLLRAAGELIAARRLERFDEWNARERVFSPRAGKRLARLAKKERRRAGRSGSRRWSLRTAAAVAVLVFLSVTAISAGPVREALVKAKIDVNEDRVRIEYRPDFIRDGESEMAIPTYIPDGYALSGKLDCKEYDAQFYDEIYECEGTYVLSGEHYKWVPSGWFEIRCFKLDEEDGVTFYYGIQDEGELYSIRVGDYEGHVQYCQGAPYAIKYTFLMWSDGIYFYSIRSTLDIVEVLRIAENMK